MTAVRIITDHSELDEIGELTHSQIDEHVLDTAFVVLSGAAGPIPSTARRLKAGAGISLTDEGIGNDLTINATVTASLPMPTQVGQILFSAVPGSFSPATPIVSLNFGGGGWLLNNSGMLLVSASL